MCEGFRGIVHGGIVSTVLDEAMSKAVFATNCQALTCELRVRFRHRVTVGEPLRIRGWVVARQKRKITAEASLCTLDGKERAHSLAIRVLAAPSWPRIPAGCACPGGDWLR
jgi:acyl-coenzyme A thioesterase PaaI-like protein